MKLIAFIFIFILAGCQYQIGTVEEYSEFEIDIKVENHGVENVIPVSLLTAYSVKGQCPNIVGSVKVVIDGVEKNPECVSSRFAVDYDLSALADGPVEIALEGSSKNNKSISITHTLIKDTAAPTGAVVISGMGDAHTADASPRLVTLGSVDSDFYFIKRKLLTSGVCAGQDFSALSSEVLTPLPYTTVLTPNSFNRICVIGGDKAGNWSAVVFDSGEVYVDTTAPVMSFSPATFDGVASTSKDVAWRVTEKFPDGAEFMTLEFSENGTTGWTMLDSRTVGTSELSNQSYTFNWSIPNITTSNGIFRLKLKDKAGLESTVLSDVVIDNLAPTLDSVILAGGADDIGLTSVPLQISATASLSAITEMRISEDSNFTGASWVPYSVEQFSFNLSQIAGLKTVYVQVRSSAGLESNVLSDSTTLDFGSPPVVQVTSPLNTTNYPPGTNVTISWSCSSTSSAGLAAVPIKRIDYTADDGVTYYPIATNLPNNLSATTGDYSWTIPAVTPDGATISATTPIRISVNCASAAGVVSSGASQILNSIWKVVAGEPGNIDENVHVSASGFSALPFHGDSSNNIYYTRKNALMKIDPLSGVVSRWMGSLEKTGCTLASGDVGETTSPEVMDITNNEMLMYSSVCTKLYKIRIADKTIIWQRDLTMNPYKSYVKSGHLIYHNNYAIYLLDLNSISSTPRLLIGSPGVCGTPGAMGTDAAASLLPCSANSDYAPIMSPDLNRVWLVMSGLSNMHLEKDTATDTYKLKTTTFTGQASRCVHTSFDSSRLFCNSVRPGSTSRSIVYLDLATGTLSSTYNMATYSSLSSNQLYTGAGKNSLYVFTTTNELFEVKYENSTWSQQKIGGTPFHSYGNGTDVSKVAFTDVSSFVYDPVFKWIYVRGTQHVRRLHINDTDPMNVFIDTIESAVNSAQITNSSANYGLAVSTDGLVLANTSLGTAFSWRSLDLSTWNGAAETVSAWSKNFYLYSASASNYPALGESFPVTTTNFLKRVPGGSQGTFLPNGKFYFPATSDTTETQDLWIFESDGTTITSVAGADGAIGFDPGSDGQTALGQRLSRVNGLQPDANGDLLIFDGPRMRRISVATESAGPKIYDEIDFTTFANYPGDLLWSHVYMDLDTGWSYFAIHENLILGQTAKLFAARQAEGFVEISIDGLLLRGTSPRALSIQKSPLGLLLLDTNKKRILATPLKPL